MNQESVMKGLLKMLYPMFSIVGDEDDGGMNDDDKTPPAEENTDEGNPPTPPAETEDDKPEISDDEFENLREVLSPEQFESINQTRMMNKRMREKMDKLVKEKQTPPTPIKKEEEKPKIESQSFDNFDPVEWVSDIPAARTAIDAVMEETGMSRKALKNLMLIFGFQGDRISKHRAKEASDPIASEFREGKFTKALDAFSSDDKYKFVMSKPEIKKEVESFIRNNYEPEDWNKPEIIKAAYGSTIADHPEIFTAGKREIVEDGSIHEKVGGSPQSGGVSSSELKEYAEDYGIDLSDPKARRAAVDGLAAKRKAEKRME
jgi:hypothetical protein